MIDAVFVGVVLAAAIGLWLAVVLVINAIAHKLFPDAPGADELRHRNLWRKSMEERQRRVRGMRP